MENALTRDQEKAVEQSLAYLESPEASASLRRDPYWPKWNSPWWHMTLLWEMGLAGQIPGPIVEEMAAAIEAGFVKFFPRSEDELPPGKDMGFHVGCHCALGTMYQVLCDCGMNVDERLPWIRPWFLKYQLPDGGLNCENEVYGRDNPKSSIVSTLPPLEAVLRHTHRSFTKEEQNFLARSAGYLIKHRLVCSAQTGKILNEDWLELCFPRFYDYDDLRGLSFLAEWGAKFKQALPDEAISGAVQHLMAQFPSGNLKVMREPWRMKKTLNPEMPEKITGQSGGHHHRFQASFFPLLEETGAIGKSAPQLSSQWQKAKENLDVIRRV